ncbi:flagellar basal body rod protein FlgB [Sinorhizobium fredii]
MDPIQLFELASRQAQWLTVRQNVVAGNIANANTPHYRAKDVHSPSKACSRTPASRWPRRIVPISPTARMPRR